MRCLPCLGSTCFASTCLASVTQSLKEGTRADFFGRLSLFIAQSFVWQCHDRIGNANEVEAEAISIHP